MKFQEIYKNGLGWIEKKAGIFNQRMATPNNWIFKLIALI